MKFGRFVLMFTTLVATSIAIVVGPAASPAAAAWTAAPVPPQCPHLAQMNSWPLVTDFDPPGLKCWLGEYGGMGNPNGFSFNYHIAEPPGVLHVGESKTFTVTNGEPAAQQTSAFTLRWFGMWDDYPLMRSIDGEPANPTSGYQDFFRVPPLFDMSGCRQPGSTDYTAGRWVHACTIKLLRGPVYKTAPNEPVPWTIMAATTRFTGSTGNAAVNVTNCNGTCGARWNGFTSLYEIPVLLEPSPIAQFTTTQTGPRKFRFDGSTSLFNGTVDQYHWDFGDGSSADGKVVNHIYPAGLDHAVPKLTVITDGQQSVRTLNLDITARRSIDLDPTIALSDETPAVNQVVTASYTVRNTGDVTVNNVVLSARTNASVVLQKVGTTSPASVSIAPGSSATFTQQWKYKGGAALLRADATGATAETSPIQVKTPTRERSVGSLPGEFSISAILTPGSGQFDLTPDARGEPIPEPFTMDVTVRNNTGEAVTSATLGNLALTTADDPAPVAEDRPAGWPNSNLGSFAIGEAKTVTYHLKAQFQGTTDVGASVNGTTSSGRSSSATTAVRVNVDEHNPVAVEWSIPKRYDRVGDEAATVERVNPTSYRFDVEYRLNGACPADATARWTISGVQVAGSPLGRCTAHFTRPDLDPYKLQVQVRRGGQQVGRKVENIEAHDYLVVSVGDSLSSGEGVMESGGWRHTPCHRSSVAGPPRAARLLEDADPHSSVTFVHLACSGASITEGLLDRYDGVTHTGDEPPQIEYALELAGGREIDAMVMSIGINDSGFGTVAKECLDQSACHTQEVQDEHGTWMPMGEFLAQRMTELAANYGVLEARMTELGIPADSVHLIEYPDELHGDDGLPAHYVSQWVQCLPVPIPYAVELAPDETEWLYPNFELALKQTVANAAAQNGWDLVSGMFDDFRLHGLDNSTADRWFQTVNNSFCRQGDEQGALHPNDKGHDAFGDIVYQDLLTTFDITPG